MAKAFTTLCVVGTTPQLVWAIVAAWSVGLFGKSVLKALAAVVQHVLAQIAEVDVEIAPGGVARVLVARWFALYVDLQPG
jgi:hypothetical protein